MLVYNVLSILIIVVLSCYFETAYAKCKPGRVWALRKHYNFKLLPHNGTCGREYVFPAHGSKKNPTWPISRMYGGVPVRLGKYPWMAHITSYHLKTYRECGGSVISERYIVSSARCFLRGRTNPVRSVTVTLGEHVLLQAQDCTPDNSACAESPIHLAATHVHMPANYSFSLKYRDFALIRLKVKIVFRDEIQPICLPFLCELRDFDFTNSKFTMAGWGDQEPETKVEESTQLRVISRHVMDWVECAHTYNGYAERQQLWKDQACTTAAVKESTCYGDEGAPVMYVVHEVTKCECTLGTRVEQRDLDGQTADEVTYLMGIVVNPFNCRIRDERPNIITLTKYYLKFILDNLKP